MTNTQTSLIWTRPELLTDATAWMCKDNAIELVRASGLEVNNATVGALCAEAIEFLTGRGSRSEELVVGYRAVRTALGFAS